MIQLSPGCKVYVCHQPVSFIKGISALCGVCREILNLDPLSGAYFVFRNRRGTMIRVLMFDGDGMWLCTKVFARGKLKHWPTQGGSSEELSVRELPIILWRGDINGVGFPKIWKKIG